MLPVTYLVPGVSSVCWIDEDGDDLGFRQKGCSPLSCHLRVKVVGTLLKVVVWTGVGRQGEVLHVPNAQQRQRQCHKQPHFICYGSFLWELCGWSPMCNNLAPRIQHHKTMLIFGLPTRMFAACQVNFGWDLGEVIHESTHWCRIQIN